MNPNDDKLSRLLDAAKSARPPIPEPSPWFEQRMVQALKAEEISTTALFDFRLIFRTMTFAAVIAAVSVILPLVQVKSPYADMLTLADSGIQWEQAQ